MADRVEVIVELVGKDEAIAGLKEIQNLAKNINGAKSRLNVDDSGVKNAERSLSSLRQTAGSAFKIIGSGMQNVGGVLTTLSFTMRRSGMMLTQMSNLFGGSIFNKAMYTVAGKAVNLFNQGLANSVQRFDTFRTFPKLMQTIGFSTEDAERAVNKLNDAVLGTPTSLNQIIDTATPLIQLYNDLDKGTDLAVAANNAFLANGTDAALQANGLAQIRDILTRGKLQATEWDSLLGSLGVSIGYIAEELGYSRDETDKFREALYEGEIGARDFLDAMIATGTGTGKMAQAASLSTEQLGSSIENVKTAFSNFGATVLETFDEILQENTGKGLAENINALTSAFKSEVIPKFAEFVRSHGDDIMGFFDKLRQFPWGDLASSISKNVGDIFGVFGNIIDKVGMDNIVKFVSFSMTWAGPLGKALRLFAAPIGIFGSLFTRFGGLFKKLGNFLGKGSAAKAAGKAAGGGLKSVGTSLLGAAGFVGIIAELGLVVAEYAKVAEYIGQRDFGNLKTNLEPLLTFMGEMTALTGGITAAMTGFTKLGLGKDILAGEGLTAAFEAVLGFSAMVVEKFADVADKISGANFENLSGSWEELGSFMTSIVAPISGVVAGLSALTGFTGGAGGLAVLAGEGLTGVLIGLLNDTADMIGNFTDVAAKIGSTEMPTDEQISRVGEVFKQLQSLFDELDIGLGWIEKGRFDRAMDALGEIVDSFSSFEKAEQFKGDIDKASKNLKTVVETMTEISAVMEDAFGEYDASTTTEQQAQVAENMSSVVTSLGDMATTFNAIKTELDNLHMAFGSDGKLIDASRFGKLKQGIFELATTMGELFTQIATSFGDASWRSKASTAAKQVEVTDSMREVLTNLQETVGIFDGIEQLLPQAGLWSKDANGVYVKFEKARDGIGKLIEGIGLISAQLQNSQTELESSAELMKTENQAGIVQNLNTVMEGLGEISETFAGLDMSKIGIGQDIHAWSGDDYFDRQVKDLEKLIQGVSDIMEVISPDGVIKSLLKRWESANKEKVAERLNESMKAINGILENVSALQISSADLDPEAFAENSKKIQQVIESVSFIMDELAGGTNVGSGVAGQTSKSFESVSQDLQRLSEAMTAIKEVISKIQGMLNSLDEIHDNEGMFKLGQVLRGVTTMLAQVPDDAGDIQERVASIKAAVDSVNELVGTLVGMQENLTTLSPGGESEGATQQIGGILSGIVESLAGADIDAIKQNLATLNSIIGNISTNMANLAAVNLEGLNEQVSTLYGQLEPLNTSLTTCQDMLMRVATNAANAKGQISALGAMAQAKQADIMNLTGHISALSSILGTAAGKASALGAAIRALQDKTVTVTYNEVRNVTTNTSGGRSSLRSGGMNANAGIRRANGGIVPRYAAMGGWMRPVGTDTVPAMLTPGEFVMRRKAVNKLGIPLMRAINSLNIPAAVQALMSRVQMPSAATVVTHNNQRTYDSHATVNQYFSDSKDKRASYRRASRYLQEI